MRGCMPQRINFCAGTVEDVAGYSSDEIGYESYTDNERPDLNSGKKPVPKVLVKPISQVDPLFLTFPTALQSEYWSEPMASSFKVRSKDYMDSRLKVSSAPNLFRLITVDLIKTTEPILTGISLHPEERIQQWLNREEDPSYASGNFGNSFNSGRKKGSSGSNWTRLGPPFIFCVNIVVPGKENHHLVAYYAVDDLNLIKGVETTSDEPDPHSEFKTLAGKFFFGNSDTFRDSTFKLIPRIVKGNIIVKKAVGSKPTIIGRKLKQSYIRNERFFELIIDVSSDNLAKKIVKLAAGYAKSLVVDMAFVLEGKDVSTLPENVMGTLRLTHIDFKEDLRFVEDVEVL
eukprot:CAMPEP_0184870232 /NCGR_PEP_ID=MMETSP0580-20130426/36883_1 /TAXON_ID=1118495 /ORGANISM="Dactyliosolen fragilissimus" /LENGTH=343 /DNA_ID=CAMNT_0027372211 /DNA_START=124 /DNA_END=1155 /DNA_ORIENTATION=-